MSEAQIAAWFAAHSLVKLQAVALVSGVAPMIVHDYQTFKQYQATHGEAIAFDPFVAMRRYAKAGVLAILPVWAAMLYRVLGM